MYVHTFVSHDEPCLDLTTLFPFLLGHLLLCSKVTVAFSIGSFQYHMYILSVMEEQHCIEGIFFLNAAIGHYSYA